ncbi:hypothetical protein BGW42_006861 [Actinomortierella wolfii]|nr:hypothetical protein BGW42_006861 [Actinomortierella wolfii]
MVAHTLLYWLAARGVEDGTIGGVPWNEALSNIAGSASIVCWFIVFTPQFWINYKRQSGESLSLVFLYIWLAGDVMNLVGAIMENLLLTMIALIAQVFYYRRTSIKATFEEAVITHPEILQQTTSHPPPPYHAIDERTALLGPGAPESSRSGYTAVAIPPSAAHAARQPADPQHHIHDNEHDQAIHDAAMKAKTAKHHHRQHSSSSSPFIDSTLSPSIRERRPSSASALTSSSAHYRAKMLKRRRRVRKALLILLPVVATLFFIWAYHDWLQCTIEGNRGDDQDSERCGRGQSGGHGKLPPPRSPTSPDDDDEGFMTALSSGDHDDTLALLLGWGSAILYLGSRIPQIYKNWRLKSCEGLSIMMFMFSVFGNVFYVASIFLYSVEYDYIITNMPWWLGSGGTLVFDFTIFFQFYKYRHNHPLEEALKDAVAAGELDADDILPEDEDDIDESREDFSDQRHQCVDEHRALKHRERDLEAGLVHPVKKSSASTSSASTLGAQQQQHPVVTVATPVTRPSTSSTGAGKGTTPAATSASTNTENVSSSSHPSHVESAAITTPEVIVSETVDRSLPASTPAPAQVAPTTPVQPSQTETLSPKSVGQQPSQQIEEPATPVVSAAAAAPANVTASDTPKSPSTPPPPAEPSTSSAPEAPSPSTPSGKSKNKKKKKKSNKKK